MKLITTTLTLILVQGAALAQNIIVNGSFESPRIAQFALYQPQETIDGAWLIESATIRAAVLSTNYTGGDVFWPNPISGTQFLYLGDATTYARIAQTISIASLGVYKLSFQLSDFSSSFNNPGWAPGGIIVVDIVNLASSQSIIGGPKTFQTANFSGFKTQTLNFTPAAIGAHKITFASVTNHAALLDDVRITASANLGTNELDIQATVSNAIAVEWVSKVGKNYKILYSENLNIWFPLGELIHGTGQILQHLEKIEAPKRFYRVIEISQ